MHVVQLLDSAEFAERFCTSSGLCAKSREERLGRGGGQQTGGTRVDVGGGTRGEVLAEGAKAQGLGRRVGRWEKEGERERGY